MKSYRYYGMLKQYFIKGKGWVSAEKFVGNIRDIETVAMNYYDYDENMEIVGSGYEDLSIDRFKELGRHVYEIEKDGVANGTLEFSCKKKDFAALSKLLKEQYLKLGSTLKSKRAQNYVEFDLMNILVRQYWDGRIEIKLHDFIAEVVRLNGSFVLRTTVELIVKDLKMLNLKYSGAKNNTVYFIYKDLKVLDLEYGGAKSNFMYNNSKSFAINSMDILNNYRKFITLMEVD